MHEVLQCHHPSFLWKLRKNLHSSAVFAAGWAHPGVCRAWASYHMSECLRVNIQTNSLSDETWSFPRPDRHTCRKTWKPRLNAALSTTWTCVQDTHYSERLSLALSPRVACPLLHRSQQGPLCCSGKRTQQAPSVRTFTAAALWPHKPGDTAWRQCPHSGGRLGAGRVSWVRIAGMQVWERAEGSRGHTPLAWGLPALWRGHDQARATVMPFKA